MARKPTSALSEALHTLAPLRPEPEPFVPWADRKASYARVEAVLKKTLRGTPSAWSRERVIAHWERIAGDQNASLVAHEAARVALRNLSRGFDIEREPGEEEFADEPMLNV